jgi:hypothetical protein
MFKTTYFQLWEKNQSTAIALDLPILDEYKIPDIDEVPIKKKLIRLKKVVEKLQCTIGIIQLYFDGWK